MVLRLCGCNMTVETNIIKTASTSQLTGVNQVPNHPTTHHLSFSFIPKNLSLLCTCCIYINLFLCCLLFSGILPLSKWCEALEAATHLGLPWRMLRERLSPPEAEMSPTEVNYQKTLILLDTDAIVSSNLKIP